MEMTGERQIAAPRPLVWQALNDPEVLKSAIPGCESVERTADDQFQARVSMKIGPMAAKFSGKVTLTNINPPAGYTITGEGNGGAIGFAKGGADVSLEEVGPSETLLRYAVKAQVGGKMAQLGARLIDSTAKQMADQFFNRFAANLGAMQEANVAAAAPAAEPALPVADSAPVSAPAAAQAEAALAAEGVAPAAIVPPAPPRSLPPPPPAPGLSMFDLIPRKPLGVSWVLWIGVPVWIIILALMFL